MHGIIYCIHSIGNILQYGLTSTCGIINNAFPRWVEIFKRLKSLDIVTFTKIIPYVVIILDLLKFKGNILSCK